MQKLSILSLLLLSLGFLLVGCSGGDDGPVLSDDEKIKKASQGRDDFAKGMQGQQPGSAPAAGGQNPAPQGQAPQGQ